ncbi:MAG: hypothetical protein AB7E12_10370 [Burkholderiaceae bacterium]
MATEKDGTPVTHTFNVTVFKPQLSIAAWSDLRLAIARQAAMPAHSPEKEKA